MIVAKKSSAKPITRANKKPAVDPVIKKTEPQFTWDSSNESLSYGDHDGGYEYEVFTMRAVTGECCGVTELAEFSFESGGGKERYGPAKPPMPVAEFAAKFQEYVFEYVEGAFAHLTLTRDPKTLKLYQPDWFVDALKAFPGASFSDWRKNPNSGNDLQMWILPV